MSQNACRLPLILQELKSTLAKLVVAVNTGGHSIHVLNERSVFDVSFLADQSVPAIILRLRLS